MLSEQGLRETATCAHDPPEQCPNAVEHWLARECLARRDVVEAVRDAAGLTPGQTAEILGPDRRLPCFWDTMRAACPRHGGTVLECPLPGVRA